MVTRRKATPQCLFAACFVAVCTFILFEVFFHKARTAIHEHGPESSPAAVLHVDEVALEEGIMSEYEKNNALVQRCVDDVIYMEPKLRVVKTSNLSQAEKQKSDNVPCTIVKVISLEKVLVFPVCVYDPAQDVSISAGLLNKGTVFEERNLLSIARWLLKEGDAGLIDIGANIGLFTMMAASLEFPVLAVEPRTENTMRIQKAVAMKEFGERVTLMQNGVSDVRSRMRLISHRREQGRTVVVCNKLCRNYDGDVCLDGSIDTILMDDLLEVITFKKAVMKIDIEGHEIRAFARSELLFKKVHIPLILMEWAWRQDWQSRSEADRADVENFIDMIVSRGYQPQHENGKVLDIKTWDMWPTDVYWVLNKT